MDGESCEFRNEELLWCRMCTPGKCLARIPEKIKSCDLLLFILVVYILHEREMEFWKLHKCGVTADQCYI